MMERRQVGKCRNLHGRSAPVSIGVVEEVPGRLIVDQTIVRIQGLGAGHEVFGGKILGIDRRKDLVVKHDFIAGACRKVLDLVDVSVGTQDNRAHAAANVALTAIYLGAAEAAQEAFIRFGHERIPANLGVPIAKTERFISAAGEIDLLVGGARQILFNALDHSLGEPEALIRARLLAARNIRDAVQLAVRTLGNPGLNGDLGIERHFRDIQSVLVHAPQEDTSVSILGRSACDRWSRKAEESPHLFAVEKASAVSPSSRQTEDARELLNAVSGRRA